jgi:hypothetical protein
VPLWIHKHLTAVKHRAPKLAIAGSMLNMFDFRSDVGFDRSHYDGFDRRLFLGDQTGEIH